MYALKARVYFSLYIERSLLILKGSPFEGPSTIHTGGYLYLMSSVSLFTSSS